MSASGIRAGKAFIEIVGTNNVRPAIMQAKQDLDSFKQQVKGMRADVELKIKARDETKGTLDKVKAKTLTLFNEREVVRKMQGEAGLMKRQATAYAKREQALTMKIKETIAQRRGLLAIYKSQAREANAAYEQFGKGALAHGGGAAVAAPAQISNFKSYWEQFRQKDNEIKLRADASPLFRTVERAKLRLGELNKIADVGLGAAMTVGVPAAIGAGMAVKTFIDFDDQMRIVQAVTGATGAEFDSLTERAKKLGAETSFTATQVAASMTEFGRMGFKTAEIQDSVQSALHLSKATATDLAEATQIASATMKAYGLETADFAHIADVLTAASNNSALTLTDLGETMKYVGPMAGAAGYKLEDMAAAAGMLADVGVRGSIAGTTLKNIITRMTGEAKGKYEELGVATTDVNGKLRSMFDILSDLKVKFGELSQSEQLTAAVELFGMRGISGVQLVNSDPKKMLDILARSEDAASKTYDKMEAGVGGSFRIMLSAIEAVAIAFGEAMAGSMSDWFDWIVSSANSIEKWIQANGAMVASIAELVAGSLAAIVALKGIVLAGNAIAALSSPIGALVVAGGLLATVFAKCYLQSQAMAKGLDDINKKLSVTVEGMNDAFAQTDQKGVDAFQKLVSLNANGVTNADQKKQADEAIQTLKSQYGDGWFDGLGVDNTTGKITGLKNAASGLAAARSAEYDANRRRQMNEIQSVIAANQARLKSLEGSRGGKDSDEYSELKKKNADLQKQYDEIKSATRNERSFRLSTAGKAADWAPTGFFSADNQKELDEALENERVQGLSDEEREVRALEQEYEKLFTLIGKKRTANEALLSSAAVSDVEKQKIQEENAELDKQIEALTRRKDLRAAAIRNGGEQDLTDKTDAVAAQVAKSRKAQAEQEAFDQLAKNNPVAAYRKAQEELSSAEAEAYLARVNSEDAHRLAVADGTISADERKNMDKQVDLYKEAEGRVDMLRGRVNGVDLKGYLKSLAPSGVMQAQDALQKNSLAAAKRAYELSQTKETPELDKLTDIEDVIKKILEVVGVQDEAQLEGV